MVPVKINHAPVGRTRTRTRRRRKRSGGEEIREKGSDPCQPVSFCPVPFLSLSFSFSLWRNDQKERIRNSCGNRRISLSLSLILVVSSLRPKFVDPNVTRRRDKMRLDGSSLSLSLSLPLSLSLFPSFEILCLVLLFPETRNERRRCRGNA